MGISPAYKRHAAFLMLGGAILASALLVSKYENQYRTTRSLASSDEETEWTDPLFHDVGAEILGSVLAFLVVCIGQAGGIGGGGLLVPLFIIVMRLGRFAIPLSKATIFGSAMTGVYMFAKKRHPFADRPLIEYDVAMILEPLTLAGTIVGVILNTIFPSWLITILLILLLSFTTKKTFAKGVKVWNQETLKKQKAAAPPKVVEQVQGETQLIGSPQTVDLELLQSDSATVGDTDDGLPEVDHESQRRLRAVAQIRSRERKAPRFWIGLLGFTWLIVLLSALLKGGHGAKSIVDMQCGSALFWVVTVLAFLVMVVVTAVAGNTIHHQYKEKVEVGFEFGKGDVEWSYRNVYLYSMICTLAGIAAGLLGIGGGMVKSPLMLEMGMLPEVTAATSMFMILFTSSSTTMQFIILGMLRLDYTLWYGGIGFIGAYVGQSVVEAIVKKYGRVSVVVFALTFVTGVSAIVMGIQGIIAAVHDFQNHNWANLRFHSMCA